MKKCFEECLCRCAVWLCLLVIAVPRTGYASDLLSDFKKSARDHESGIRFLQASTSEQLFTLCNEYGDEVDQGRTSPEGPFIEACLAILDQRGDLTAAKLLEASRNKENSVYWRVLAIRHASGRSGILKLTDTAVTAVCTQGLELAGDTTAPHLVRSEAVRSVGDALAQGYRLCLGESGDSGRSVVDLLRSESEKARDDQLPCFATTAGRTTEFVGLLCAAAEGRSTRLPVDYDALAYATRVLLRECGLYTPGLEAIRKTLSNLQQERLSLPKGYVNLMNDIKRLEHPEDVAPWRP